MRAFFILLGLFGCFPVNKELSGQLINFTAIQNLYNNKYQTNTSFEIEKQKVYIFALIMKWSLNY